jgi:hypothetical protein
VVTGVAFMLLLFPIGTLPSRRWRPVAALELVATAITLAGVAVQPGLVGLPAPRSVARCPLPAARQDSRQQTLTRSSRV